MHAILDEIEQCVASSNFYAAITLALTVPDVGGALGAPDGRSDGARYQAWYDSNLSARYPWLTAKDFYSLRCGVVHQGQFRNSKLQFSRVLFTLPEVCGAIFHNNVLNDALNLDAGMFCDDVVASGRLWLSENENNAIVQTNLARSVKFYPQGLAPYMVGMPLIS